MALTPLPLCVLSYAIPELPLKAFIASSHGSFLHLLCFRSQVSPPSLLVPTLTSSTFGPTCTSLCTYTQHNWKQEKEGQLRPIASHNNGGTWPWFLHGQSNSTPSIELLWLNPGWTPTQLTWGFTLVTYPVKDKSCSEVSRTIGDNWLSKSECRWLVSRYGLEGC